MNHRCQSSLVMLTTLACSQHWPCFKDYQLLVIGEIYFKFSFCGQQNDIHEFAVPDSNGSWASCLGSPESPAKKQKITMNGRLLVNTYYHWFCGFERQKSNMFTVLIPSRDVTYQTLRGHLKGHGNEPNFPRFLHKSLCPRSLTLHIEPFRFSFEFAEIFVFEKQTTPRIGESGSRQDFFKPLNNSIVIVHYIPGKFLAKLIL